MNKHEAVEVQMIDLYREFKESELCYELAVQQIQYALWKWLKAHVNEHLMTIPSVGDICIGDKRCWDSPIGKSIHAAFRDNTGYSIQCLACGDIH